MSETRTASENCTALITASEGLRTRAYLDTGGVPTIGYGHTRGVKIGDVCTVEQADGWLRSDLAAAETVVAEAAHVSLNQNQFDALASFAFNVGGSQFRGSTLLKYVNQGRCDLAAEQFARWKYDAGKIQPGLVVRRENERQLFERPI